MVFGANSSVGTIKIERKIEKNRPNFMIPNDCWQFISAMSVLNAAVRKVLFGEDW